MSGQTALRIEWESIYEYREKLALIQTLTQQDDQTAILAAIDLDYTQLTQAPDPLARLKASKLIGSFNGDPDLSEQSEILFREHIQGRA